MFVFTWFLGFSKEIMCFWRLLLHVLSAVELSCGALLPPCFTSKHNTLIQQKNKIKWNQGMPDKWIRLPALVLKCAFKQQMKTCRFIAPLSVVAITHSLVCLCVFSGTTERVCLIQGTVEALNGVHDFIAEKVREMPQSTQKTEPVSILQPQTTVNPDRVKQVRLYSIPIYSLCG